MKNTVDINFKNLKCSVQKYCGCGYLCRKRNEETCFEVIDLAFSISYNKSCQLPFMFCRTVFMH